MCCGWRDAWTTRTRKGTRTKRRSGTATIPRSAASSPHPTEISPTEPCGECSSVEQIEHAVLIGLRSDTHVRKSDWPQCIRRRLADAARNHAGQRLGQLRLLHVLLEQLRASRRVDQHGIQ